MPFNAEQQRERYEQKRARGLCIACTRNPSYIKALKNGKKEELSRCKECLARNAKWMESYRAKKSEQDKAKI